VKKIVLIIIILLIASNSWAVIITGTGTTKEEAISNGLREAVEMYTSSLVYGVTDVENYQIKKDQVVAASLGYVKKYRILKIKEDNEIFLVTMNVTLSEDKIEDFVRKDVNFVTYEEVIKDYSNIVQRQSQIKKLAEMYRIMIKRPIHEKYGVLYEGYEVKHIGAEYVDLILNVRITQNPFYHKAYNEILKNLSEPHDSREVDIYRGKYRIHNCNMSSEKYYISRDVGLPSSNVEAQIYANGTPIDDTDYEYTDNMVEIANYAVRVITGTMRFGNYIMRKLKDEDANANKCKYMQNFRIIPTEGLPLRIKYRVTDMESIKNLRTLKLTMDVCEEVKKEAERKQMRKERGKIGKKERPKKEWPKTYRNAQGALVIDDGK